MLLHLMSITPGASPSIGQLEQAGASVGWRQSWTGRPCKQVEGHDDMRPLGEDPHRDRAEHGYIVSQEAHRRQIQGLGDGLDPGWRPVAVGEDFVSDFDRQRCFPRAQSARRQAESLRQRFS
jgi:hypothetical protein